MMFRDVTSGTGRSLATLLNPTGTTNSYFAIGTNPAQAGALRLPNAGVIYFRNAANSGDWLVLNVNSSDQVYLGNTACLLSLIGSYIAFATASGVVARVEGDGSFRCLSVKDQSGNNGSTPANIASAVSTKHTQNTDTNTSNSSFAVGTSPAQSGTLRIPNAGSIAARNAADSGDVVVASVNSSNNVIFSNTSSSTTINGSTIYFTTASGTVGQVNGDGSIQCLSIKDQSGGNASTPAQIAAAATLLNPPKTQFYSLYVSTTGATPTYATKDGAAPGASNQYVLTSPTSLTSAAYDVLVVATTTSAVSSWAMRGSVKRASNGTMTLDTGGVKEILSKNIGGTSDVTMTVDSTNKALQVQVTGVASTNINWTAFMRIAEATI
jgi:hypothetical protein